MSCCLGSERPFSGLAEIKPGARNPKVALLSPRPALAGLPPAQEPGHRSSLRGVGRHGNSGEPGLDAAWLHHRLPFLRGCCRLPALKERENGAWETAIILLWVFIPLSQSRMSLGLPYRQMYGGCPHARCPGRSKLLLTAPSIHACAHTHIPAPPKRLITYALCLVSKIFSFPSFVCFPNPLSSLAFPAARTAPAGKGTLCSH